MTSITLADLQASVRDRSAFGDLDDYFTLCLAFLSLIKKTQPTRIISPSHHNYIFYQYSEAYGHRITRPLNVDLFIESYVDPRPEMVTNERLHEHIGDLQECLVRDLWTISSR